MSIECAFFSKLSADAEQKVSKAGKPYLKLSFRLGEGEEAEWVNVLSFDERALQDSNKFVRGARVYIEGKLSLNRYKGLDGGERSNLSVLSWHTRLSQIGLQKVKRDSDKVSSAAGKIYHSPRSAPAGTLPDAGNNFHDDEIPF